jgi:hypothetical protein
LSEGEYFLWFLNNGAEINPTFNLEQGLKAEFTVHSISATKINAIGTSMAFTNKGSVIGQDITGITEGKIINPISFGYVHVIAEPIFIPIYGSSDTSCLNYVSNANTFEDCIPKIYGSLDRDCANYRADANVIVPCIPKEPVPCMKKRWLFTSLPCKPSKNNVCNCN